MSQPVVKVEGMRRLRTELRRAGIDLSDLREINMGAARTVTAAAMTTTPRDEGTLASTVRAGASKTAGVVRAGGARVPYAGPIHWGWPDRNIDAQPWLVDAAKATEPVWVEQFYAELDRVLTNIAGGPS